MTKQRISRIKGIASAFTVGVLQGIEGVLFTLLGLIVVIAGVISTPSASVAFVLLRETIIVLLMIIVFAPKIAKAYKLLRDQKNTRFYLVSGVFTAMGNAFFTLGVAFAGPSYGVVLTSFYPVFALIMVRIIFKESQNYKVWIGAGLTVVSGGLFLFLPEIITNSGNGFSVDRVLGMVFGMLCALFWALEGIMIKKGSHSAPRPIAPLEATLMRSFSAWFTTLIFIFPLSFALGNTGKIVADFVTSWQAMILVFVVALSSFVLRIVHVFAIYTIGPRLTAIIDNNNFLVPPFLILFLQFANLQNAATGAALFVPFEWWAWLLVIPILAGVLLVIFFEKVDKATPKTTTSRHR